MVFTSRVVPVFMLQMTNISGPSIGTNINTLLTKITAAQNLVALSYQ